MKSLYYFGSMVIGLILTLASTACCQTYYRFNGKEYYRVDKCPGSETVKCTSDRKLPNEECF